MSCLLENVFMFNMVHKKESYRFDDTNVDMLYYEVYYHNAERERSAS